MTHDDLFDLMRAEAIRRGYRFEVTTEGATEVVRLIRPDGSLAVKALKPLTDAAEVGWFPPRRPRA
jgi:hypothetical protein